jgi:hypothetical protein
MPFFDTVPFSALYGGYTDSYFTGSFLVQKSGDFSVVTNSLRGEVFSIVNSTTDETIITNTILPENYSYSFTEYRTALSQSKTLVNKSIRYLQATSQYEYYYDSFVPDINEIFNVDDGKLILFNNGKGSASPIFEFEYIFGTYTYSASINQFVQHTLTSSTGTQVSNNAWCSSFPFEIKYRNATRLQGRPFTLSTLNYRVSGSVYNQSDLEVYVDTPSLNTRAVTNLPPGGAFGYWQNNTPSFTFGQSAGIIFGFLFPSGGLPTDPDSSTYSPAFQTIRGLIADKDAFASASTNFQTSAPAMILTASTDRTNIKFVYGFGDGFANFGEFVTNQSGMVKQFPMSSVFFGSLIRGWKYGLKSGFPEQSKVLIHRSRYGGLNSVLGGRYYGAMYDTKTGKLTYPIQTTFLSGSQAALTSSSPSTLNTRDSGIYDVFYRSGRPFFD